MKMADRKGHPPSHGSTGGLLESGKRWASEHGTSVKAWTFFILAAIVVFIFLSDRDFSFLLTLSSLVSAFCFFMVAQKIERSGSVAGVSMKMMECYLVLLGARLCSIIPFEGYFYHLYKSAVCIPTLVGICRTIGLETGCTNSLRVWRSVSAAPLYIWGGRDMP